MEVYYCQQLNAIKERFPKGNIGMMEDLNTKMKSDNTLFKKHDLKDYDNNAKTFLVFTAYCKSTELAINQIDHTAISSNFLYKTREILI